MAQLILHLVGDYLTQSDWMAQNKRQSSVAAGAHALVYSLPFLLLTTSPLAFAFILGTHFLIDRFGLARYLVWAKNWITPNSILFAVEAESRPVPRWGECTATGYPPDRPVWLSVWLTIIADNTLHLICNYVALRFL